MRLAALLLAITATATDAYDMAVTFTEVEHAEAYVVTVGETRTVVAAGGDPYAPTTVSVEAIGLGTISAPSNTLVIPAQVAECEQYDLDGDGVVTSSDALELLLTVQGGFCQ